MRAPVALALLLALVPGCGADSQLGSSGARQTTPTGGAPATGPTTGFQTGDGADATAAPGAPHTGVLASATATGKPTTTPVAPATPAADDQGGATAKATTTGGSGGQTGSFEGTFGTTGKYRIVVPADIGPNKAYGLLVFLHGSSASNYATFAQTNAKVAAANGLMSVSVLAPNGGGWNETPKASTAQYLDDFLKNTLFKQYNIDTSKVFFHGQSSGSGFLSDTFLPAHVNDYKGGAVVLCGSGVPKFKTPPTPDAQKSFRLYFDVTTNDGIWTDGWQPTVDAYQAAGLDVGTPSTLPPGGHCQFNQQQILSQVLPGMIAANAGG